MLSLSGNGVPPGDLTLLLRNDSGLPQDGFDVRWTVFGLDGVAASGLMLPATRVSAGRYVAPWGCARAGGCYSIRWEFSPSPGGVRQSWCQDFFVLDGGCCPCCSPAAVQGPTAGCGAFRAGQVLGPGDLCLDVIDEDGLPASAFLVFWTIFDSRGCPVTPRTQATPGPLLGEYCVRWTACGRGDMSVKWEWMLDSDSPMESVCDSFSVVVGPFLAASSSVPNWCCPPSPPPQVVIVQGGCHDHVRVSRVLHLPSQVLPAGGQFTNQAPYAIPDDVSKIAFYVTYTRAVPGGFCVIRLKWGNGTEETQATVLMASSTPGDQVMRLSDLMGPIPGDDSPIGFMLETSVPGGSSTVRLLAAEGGVVGLPGTASISLTGS